MSQSNSSSSSSSQDLLDAQANSGVPQVPGTGQPIPTAPAKPPSDTSGRQNDSTNSAHGAPVPAPAVTKSRAYRYILPFALLVLVAAIFLTKGPGLGTSSPEPTGTPAVAESTASPSLRTSYVDTQVGDYFEFGRYPQDANGEIMPITWRVLQREADHLLAIAEKGLGCKPYNEEWCDITWADCTLRRWLNSEFYDKAFNEQERKHILQTSIVNNAGPKTEDYIFLLSVDEAKSLFANDDERRAKPTEYAIKNGVYTNEVQLRSRSFNGFCVWWLRSRGGRGDNAAFVGGVSDGGIGEYGIGVHDVCNAFRPALKLAL